MMSLALALILAQAEDKEVPVRNHRFVNQELEKHTEMDEDSQKALKEFLTLSKCRYVSRAYRASGKEIEITKPEIFSIPGADCRVSGSATSAVTYCGATISCENRNTHFRILNAICKSVTATSCPTAQSCAMASHLTRSFASDNQPSPDGKQQRLVQQDRRGWDASHVNRYSWAIADEIDMDRWEKEAAAKKSKSADGDER